MRYFQSKNGLTADGIVGSATQRALGMSSATSISDSDFNLLARVISAEARGEPYTGQVAVGRRHPEPGGAPLVPQHHLRRGL